MFERSLTFERAANDDGMFEIAISSEAPYERFFGIEILRHDADAVDMTRLGDGRHPLLLNHDTAQQIGVVREVRIDADKKLRGRVQFSDSALGQEIRRDVEQGIRSHVSVGYFIDELQEVKRGDDGGEAVVRTLDYATFRREMEVEHGDCWNRAGQAAARGKGETPPTFVVTRWTPFEASIVPVPADVSVGVGRSAGVDSDPVPAAPPPQIKTIKEIRIMSDLQKTPAELEIERRDAIAAIGEQYKHIVSDTETAQFIRTGKGVEAFKDFIIEKITSKHSDTRASHIGLSPKEIKRYSFGKALVASLTGDWREAGFERECSEAVAKIMGRGAEGFYLPNDVFARDFNVGSSTEAGNLVATNLRTDLFVDVLRNNLVMGQLGARILGGLSGNVDMPRKATASTIGTVTEIGSASETNPVTAKVTLSPKRASAYVEVSKQALIQSAMALESMIRDDLVSGAAVHVENMCFNGVGSNSQPLGIRNTTGIGTATSGANGGFAWADIVNLESACANANAEPDQLAGYAINTKTRGKAKQTQLGTNLPFIWQNGAQPLNGYRAAVTNNLPSNLTKGTSTTVCSAAIFGSDWSMATIGLFGAPDVVVDPYTKADTGQVKITLNQYYDFGVRQPAAFAKIEDLLA